MNNRLPVLAEAASRAHQNAESSNLAAATAALEAGAMLSEAKALLPHGSWLKWLSGTRIPERSAQRYMLLHRGGLKSAMVADLGQAICANYASLGLRLWPNVGKAWMQAQRAGPSERLAIWHPIDDGSVRYGLADLGVSGENGWCGVYPSILLPWGLGVVHRHWIGADVDLHPIDIYEATTELDTWAWRPA